MKRKPKRRIFRRVMREVGFYLTASFVFMGITIVGFTLFYYFVERGDGEGQVSSMLDAFYFTVITTRTIGFGDISPTTTAGKIGTILNALLPATVFMGASLVVLERLLKSMEEGWRSLNMKRFRDHTIVIADLDLIPAIVDECRHDQRPFVVVHPSPFSQLPLTVSDSIDESEYIQGDPTLDTVLTKAMVQQAGRLLVATNDDTTNLFVLVSCRGLNPNVTTIVRVNNAETSQKMKAVGATYTVPAAHMLGRMLSQAAENPISHNFLLRLHTHAKDPFLAEMRASKADVGKLTTTVYPQALAVYRDHEYLYDVNKQILKSGDVILVLASAEQGTPFAES